MDVEVDRRPRSSAPSGWRRRATSSSSPARDTSRARSWPTGPFPFDDRDGGARGARGARRRRMIPLSTREIAAVTGGVDIGRRVARDRRCDRLAGGRSRATSSSPSPASGRTARGSSTRRSRPGAAGRASYCRHRRVKQRYQVHRSSGSTRPSPPSARSRPRSAAGRGRASSRSPARRARRPPRTSSPRFSPARACDRRQPRELQHRDRPAPDAVPDRARTPRRSCASSGCAALGQIAYLTDIAAPDVGVITSVGPVHLELMGTVEAVAAAKAEILELEPGATSPSCRTPSRCSSLTSPAATARRDLRRGRWRRRASGRDRRRQGGDRPPRSNPDRAGELRTAPQRRQPRRCGRGVRRAWASTSTCRCWRARRRPRSRAGAASGCRFRAAAS